MTSDEAAAEPLLIPREIHDEMVAHCLREAPLECCGILGGIPPRVSSFHPLGNTAPRDLRLMSSVRDVSDIPTGGRDLIIVATVDNVLHFRVFDGDGKVVVDTGEKSLKDHAGQIEELRKQLVDLWPPHVLAGSENGRVITAVASIVGHTRTAASKTRYDADPRDVIDAHVALRQREAEILAIYHSHPRWEPVPSATDLRENHYGPVPRIIVSLKRDSPEVRVWKLDSDSFVGCDLRLMSSVKDASDIPTDGKDLIIVAAVDNVLHFRMFDRDGKVVVDTDEAKLPERARQIEDLRKQLVGRWLPHELTGSEKDRVIIAVTSFVGRNPFVELAWQIIEPASRNASA